MCLIVCSSHVSAREEFDLHVYAIADQRAFTAKSAADVLQGIHRNADFLLLSVDILLADSLSKLKPDPDLDMKRNPVLGKGGVNWHQFLRFEVTSRSAQKIWSHKQLTLEFFKVDKPSGGPLTFFKRTKDGLEGGVSSIVKIRVAGGGKFPEGTLLIKVNYDSSNNQGGIEPLRIEGGYRPVIGKAVTKLELLEAKFQLSRIRDLVHDDIQGEIKILKEILAEREASARVHRAIAYAFQAAGNLKDALKHARRYQVIFEGKLDSTWFTNSEFHKAGYYRTFWDMKTFIKEVEAEVAKGGK
ncbi:hypothetical protein JYT15_01145 [Acidimicrobium ferrooxidans]|nr:hypothetical protein [Acidimicrobium ferrooxidans]